MRTDERIAEYLRSRGVASPPVDLVDSVMAAVDAAPEPRSWFRANVPVLAAAGAAAVVVAVALLLGPFRDIGPAPAPTGTPAPTAEAATLADLEAAVTAATDRLATAPAVEGTHTYAIEGYLASATWFDWRPSGEQVVITRTDTDVSAPWWTDPDGAPLSIGERIATDIWVIVANTAYTSRDEAWLVMFPEDAPRVLTWGTGMLSGEISSTGGLEAESDAWVSHRVLTDGGEVWRVEAPGDDTTAEWRIGPDGRLESYVVEGSNLAVSPTVDLRGAHARVVIAFNPVDDPDSIPAPDPDAVPDASLFGLPADFALEPAPVSLDDVEQVETCEHPSGRYRVTLPDGWWTNRDGGRDALWEACELFGPEPFPVTPDADRTWPSGVALTTGWIDGGCVGSFLALLSSEEASVDGLPAGVAEYAWGTSSDDPPGLYEYVINLSAPGVDCEVGGRFITAATSVEMAGDYEENKSFLDQIMDGMEITPP